MPLLGTVTELSGMLHLRQGCVICFVSPVSQYVASCAYHAQAQHIHMHMVFSGSNVLHVCWLFAPASLLKAMWHTHVTSVLQLIAGNARASTAVPSS